MTVSNQSAPVPQRQAGSVTSNPRRLRPIFVIGMPRSGTTVVGSAIASSPRCIVVPEAQFLVDGLTRFGSTEHNRQDLVAYLKGHYRFGIWGFTLPTDWEASLPPKLSYADFLNRLFVEYGADKPEADFIVEHAGMKRNHLDMLSTVYPDAIFVHLVRDGRAVAASQLAVNWGQQDIISLAKEWAAGVRKTHEMVAAMGDRIRHVDVRFEDFVATKGMALARVFEAAEIDPPEIHTGSLAVPAYTADQHQLLGKEISAARIDKWKTSLTPRQIELYEYYAGSVLRDNGFDCVHSDPKAPSSIEKISAYVLGISKRIYNKPFKLYKKYRFSRRAL